MVRWGLHLIAATALAAPAGALNLDSLLVQSVGGPAALDSLRTFHNYRAAGRVSLNGRPGEFTMFYAEPDLFYAEMRFGAISMVQAFDGSTAWMRDFNGQISELGGFEEKELLKQIYLQSFAYLIDGRVPGSTAYVGSAAIDGRAYHEVLFLPLNDDTIRVYFDAQTAHPVFMHSKLDNIATRSVNSDFRVVSGVLLAFCTQSEAVGAPISTETQIDELVFNASFDHAVFYREGKSAVDFHFPADADSIAIPFEYEDGHVIVPVVLNGAAKSWFILDSGASANLIDQALAEHLKLTEVGTIAARGVAGFDEVDLVQSDSISVGELVLYSQTAGRLDLSAVLRRNNDKPRGGILGYDFLSRFPVLVDYESRRLIVYNPDTFRPAEGGVVIPFSLTSRVPTIEAAIDGVRGSFVVDVGNAFGLILHGHFVAAGDIERRLIDESEPSGTLGGVGGTLSGRAALVPSLSFGSVHLDSVPVIIPDSHMGLSGSESLAGNIGNRILQRFSVLFDYQASRLIFYPNER
ncbi:MAG: retropepsin-like aspartic protease [candidate division Zixibacteria bacterium]|jgi:hypothetical protein|nr:retropepsin-like aspartic protease [candidate division Zixibacteria bacterium]